MELLTTPRVEVLRALAREITNLYGKGRVVIAVEGPLGTEPGRFADDLGAVLAEGGRAVVRASERDFLRSSAALAALGADTPERFARSGVDRSLLSRVLLDPFRLGGSTGFQTRGFDAERDVPVEAKWETAPADAYLLVDGRFLGGSRLAGLWNFRVVLDESPLDAADTVYFVEERARETASAVYDDRDPEHPRRRFLDSC